jgi:hypothetical protein
VFLLTLKKRLKSAFRKLSIKSAVKQPEMLSSLIILFSILSLSVADTGPSDYSQLDPARNPSTPLFANSTNNAEILALQNALAGVTFSTGLEPNGVFDDATSKALVSFQQSVSIPSSEIGFVSVNTMKQFDLMLGIQSCPSYGLGRLAGDKVTTQISDGAVATLDAYWDFPVGTEIPFFADNQSYVGRVELHYHPWGGSMHPYGYHHGISVFYYIPEIMNSMSGSQFLDFSATMSISQREDAILLQLGNKNIPSKLLSNFQEITVKSTDNKTSVMFKVLPDYLSIGNDEDYIRFPCAAFTAQKIADLFNCSVPTTKMVDLIWSAATTKLAPQPIPPSDTMCSNDYVLQENQLIQTQLHNAQDTSSLFIGGDKKDTVLTNQYTTHTNSVAEYGWHQLDGTVIQPLYLGHSCDWADYSMGIRLVANEVLVNGTTKMTLAAALADSTLSALLSKEGPIVSARIPINKRSATVCWKPPSSASGSGK